MKIASTIQTIDKMLELLKTNQLFCFTRYGDTQLMLMDGWIGHPHEQMNSPKLQELMIKAFQIDDPRYLIAPSCGYELEPGMESGLFSLYRNDADLVKTVEKYVKTKELWHCEAIHYGMLYHQEKVKELFSLIWKKRTVIVAGSDLDVWRYFHGDYVFIPMANAFSSELIENTLKKIYEFNPEIVLLSCGPVSQILQYFMFIDQTNITTINMGSVFNALLGITEGPHTRAWIRYNMDKIQKFVSIL